MNLERVPNEEKLNLCRKYYLGQFPQEWHQDLIVPIISQLRLLFSQSNPLVGVPVGGFALLPFLWLVNVIWFFKEAFLKPSYSEQTQIKTYVKRSALGVLFWAVVLSVWISVFQHFRAEWGEVGDYLSFTIPLGTP